MDYVKHIQMGIDYIEAHLEDNLSSAAVAKHACISQWHFQRMFKALTNETLKGYIRGRRLANALTALLESDAKIIDIALNAGFESQESFTRAFKQAFSMTPKQVRTLGDKKRFLKKLAIDEAYLQHINTNLSLKPEIYKQPQMRMVGLKTDYYSVDSEKNNLGEKLPALWDEFIPRMDEINSIGNAAYGVIQQTEEKTDHLEYYAALEVASFKSIPKGMVSLTVDTSYYAKFTHRGLPIDVNSTINYIYSNWLMQSGKQHNYQHSYAPDIEIYDENYIADSPESIMYYAVPVVEIN